MEYKKLSDGREIPAIGFGCYNAKAGDNYQIISDAIRSGYRFFDTASFYETEVVLGKAIKDSGIPREEFFIQSKAWLDEMGYDEVKCALDRTLERLQMDYIDIYLIHWPRQIPENAGAPGYPEIECARPEYDATEDWKELQAKTCKAMEELVDAGKIRGIGLSNFLPHHLDNILSFCNVKPVVDQLEFHLGYTQERARSYAAENDIRVQAWSPLGRGAMFEDELVASMAEKYKVSVSQLALRFIYQCGVIPLPKATSPERQKQNLDIFNFEISKDDFNFL